MPAIIGWVGEKAGGYSYRHFGVAQRTLAAGAGAISTWSRQDLEVLGQVDNDEAG